MPHSGPDQPSTDLLQELELARAAARGDAAAQEAVAQRMRCVPRILKVLNGRRGSVLSAHDLEDLGQDVVLKILNKLESFAGHVTFQAWAYQFCHLEYMNRLRSKVRGDRVVTMGIVEDPESATPQALPFEPSELGQWLERMAPAESEVIRLRLYDQWEFAEIADLLGARLSTIRSRYYRGIAWLQERLESLQGECR